MPKSDSPACDTPLDYDAWTSSLRVLGSRYNPVAVDRKSFAGWARPFTVCGLRGLDLGCNADHIERTFEDVRFDHRDHYFALFQVAGPATMVQNDQAAQLAVGDVAIVDTARPVLYRPYTDDARWLSLQLPRGSLACDLGFEPLGGTLGRHGSGAARLLNQIVLDALRGDEVSSPRTASYMQLAVYDLLGALFAPPDLGRGSRSTDKLFARVCGVMRERFTDPDFGPFEAAVETGISLRYVQKLFTERGTTCTQFLCSLRLDRAAQLLRRRALLGNAQALSEIAFACGYSDYTYFARSFRRRFGSAPGVLASGRRQDAVSTQVTDATN